MADEPLIRVLLDAIRRHHMIATGEKILVAVSGGRDSMALLHALSSVADRLGVKLVAGHVDHNLRPESPEEAAFVVEQCRRMGVPALLRNLDGDALRRQPGGVEQAARKARYRALEEMARCSDAGRIATGHHQEDQALTVLFRALRGTGGAGLSGILPVVDRVVRPLLYVSRNTINAYVAAHRIPYRDDPSNEDPNFTRNLLRRRVLPACEEAVSGSTAALSRLAQVSRLETQVLDELVLEDWGQWIRRDAGDYILDLGMTGLGEGRRMLLIRRVLRSLAGLTVDLSRIRRVDALLASSSPSAWAGLGGGWVAHRHYRHLRISKDLRGERFFENNALPVPGNIVLEGVGSISAEAIGRPSGKAPPGPNTAWLSPAALRGELKVCSPREGDRYHGSGGGKKLSDLFIDAKIPAATRASIPVVRDDLGIVWVAGFAPDQRVAHPLDESELLILRFLSDDGVMGARQE